MRDLLAITTCGGLHIHLGGAPLANLGSRKAEALLVYLASRRRPQAREVLADLLWDERSSAQALANLRWLLTHLRRELAPYLQVTRQAIGLDPAGPYWLDVAEFEDHLARARGGRTRGDSLTPGAVADLEQAVALYTGPFLQGFYVHESSGFEGWMLREQDRLQQVAGAALHDLVSYYLERGAYPAGMAHAARLLEIDRWDEETHRQMMLLLEATGQQRAALEQYASCRRLLAAEFGTPPAPATTELYERMRAGALPAFRVQTPPPGRAAGARRRPEHLPHPLTPFIGRDVELDELAGYLAATDCPLVTLVGAGGAGKTRLAVQAAQASQGFPDGVYFVSLVAVEQPALLVPAIADALGFVFTGADDIQAQLVRHLRERQLLLVLDNFEHLLPAAGVLADLLAGVPGLHLLVTSREPLNLSAEQIFDVIGLAMPPDGPAGPVEEYSAVALFVQRARRVQAHFTLEGESALWVVRICRFLDGLPLGIELAAAGVRDHPVRLLAEGLGQNLDLLASQYQDVPQRHRSLRAVFDQSWACLNARESQVMRGVAVFRGGLDGAAAACVLSADRALMARLVQKSLLRLTPGARYEIHELLRQYAEAKLAATPAEYEDLVARHTAYFLAFAERASPHMRDQEQGVWLDRLASDRANLEAVLTRSRRVGAHEAFMRLWCVMSFLWTARGHWYEARRLADPAWVTEGNLPPALRAQALNQLGVLAYGQGDYGEARALYTTSLALRQAAGDPVATAQSLGNLAWVARMEKDYRRATLLCEESLALNRAAGHDLGIAGGLLLLGELAYVQEEYAIAVQHYEGSAAHFAAVGFRVAVGSAWMGLGDVARAQADYRRAARYYEDVLAVSREIGNQTLYIGCCWRLGQVAWQTGDLAGAHARAAEGLTLALHCGDRETAATCLAALAEVAHSNGELVRAATLFASAASLRGLLNTAPDPADQLREEQAKVAVRDGLGAAAWAAAWAAGGALSLDAAVAYALAAAPSSMPL